MDWEAWGKRCGGVRFGSIAVYFRGEGERSGEALLGFFEDEEAALDGLAIFWGEGGENAEWRSGRLFRGARMIPVRSVGIDSEEMAERMAKREKGLLEGGEEAPSRGVRRKL